MLISAAIHCMISFSFNSIFWRMNGDNQSSFLVCEPKSFSLFFRKRKYLKYISHENPDAISKTQHEIYVNILHSLNVRKQIRTKCSIRTGNFKKRSCKSDTFMSIDQTKPIWYKGTKGKVKHPSWEAWENQEKHRTGSFTKQRLNSKSHKSFSIQSDPSSSNGHDLCMTLQLGSASSFFSSSDLRFRGATAGWQEVPPSLLVKAVS